MVSSKVRHTSRGHYVLIDVGRIGTAWKRLDRIANRDSDFKKTRKLHLVDGTYIAKLRINAERDHGMGCPSPATQISWFHQGGIKMSRNEVGASWMCACLPRALALAVLVVTPACAEDYWFTAANADTVSFVDVASIKSLPSPCEPNDENSRTTPNNGGGAIISPLYYCHGHVYAKPPAAEHKKNAWSIVVFMTDVHKKIKYSRRFYQYDCDNKSYHTLSIYNYSNSGTVIDSFDDQGGVAELHAVPGSIGEADLGVVCSPEGYDENYHLGDQDPIAAADKIFQALTSKAPRTK